MKQLQQLYLLYAGFLTGLWMSLKLVQCSKSNNGIYYHASCYDTRFERTCSTTFFISRYFPVRRSFENASDWCKTKVPGSSLVVIKSEEDQHNVESFIVEQALENETIITDARKLSTNESRKWSWVNGHHIIPNVAINMETVAALYFQQNSPAYLPDNARSSRHYICEYSDSKQAFGFKQNNKSYVASNKTANWYDARKECLRLGGDLASITNLQTIGNWSRLIKNQIYWIGLHRYMWIWNKTGAAITYTNWKDGFPDESSDKQCICINPKCNRTICDYDRKWRTCNCNHNYAIVCQTKEDSDVSTTKSVVTEEMLPSTSAEYTTTIGLFNSFNTKEILIILLPLVAVAFIVAAVILVIRNCKHDRRNERTYTKNETLKETVSSAYTAVVQDSNRPSESIIPHGSTIYANVEMTLQTAPSNDTIYANVQPTCGMGNSVVYDEVGLNFPQKDQQKSRRGVEETAFLSHIYAEPYEQPISVSNTEYAEPYNLDK